MFSTGIDSRRRNISGLWLILTLVVALVSHFSRLSIVWSRNRLALGLTATVLRNEPPPTAAWKDYSTNVTKYEIEDPARFLRWQGIWYVATGQSLKAEEVFRDDLARFPDDGVVKRLLVNLYLQQGKYYRSMHQSQTALHYFQSAYNLWHNPDAAAWAGYVSQELGNYEEAVQYLTEAIRMRSYYSNYYYWRATAYRSMRQMDKAFSDYQSAIERSGWSQEHEAEIRLALGSLYCELEYPVLAEQEFSRVRALVPGVSTPANCLNFRRRP